MVHIAKLFCEKVAVNPFIPFFFTNFACRHEKTLVFLQAEM